MYYPLHLFFFFQQKTAYEVRISDWSSDVCSSDLCSSTGLSGNIFGSTRGAADQCEARSRPKSAASRMKGPRRSAGPSSIRLLSDQRLENWKLRRALARPYFLRSTTRESRVRKPPLFSTGRRPGS